LYFWCCFCFHGVVYEFLYFSISHAQQQL
jgi:hypothetical protein